MSSGQSLHAARDTKFSCHSPPKVYLTVRHDFYQHTIVFLLGQQLTGKKYCTRSGLSDTGALAPRRIGWGVPSDWVAEIVTGEDELPWSVLLGGLQIASEQQGSEQPAGEQPATAWQRLEPAMAQLVELILPEKSLETVTAAGDNWWLEIGPVDLRGRIVTIQRADCLIAAIAPRPDGRLRVATYRPLDGKSAGYLTGLSQNPHPDGGVCFRENNWEYALDCSAGTGNFYAAIDGEAHLSYWESGLGIQRDGTELPEWRAQIQLPTRPGNHVATELGTYLMFAGGD